MERRYYIDNLRWMAVLLLFPFHAAQIWSGGDYSGFYVWSHTNQALYAFSIAVYPWFMTLLPGTWLPFAAITAVSFLLTMLSYEIIRRIPYIRALFGLAKKDNANLPETFLRAFP